MKKNGKFFTGETGLPPAPAGRGESQSKLQKLLEERGGHCLGWRGRALLLKALRRELAAGGRA